MSNDKIGNVCPALVTYGTSIIDDSWSKTGFRQVQGMTRGPHEPAELETPDSHYWKSRGIAVCKHCGSLYWVGRP